MIRFIDIRNQGTGYRFAFFDTTVNQFVEVDGSEVFDSYDDLEFHKWPEPMDKKAKDLNVLVDRLIGLCPEWIKDGQSDDLEKFYELD